LPASESRLLGLSDAQIRSTVLRLGEQEIELLSIVPGGRPYPRGVGAADTIFQHIAIVVADMNEAVARLAAAGGAVPISTDGPQTLPASSGGVAAYKFRDPEGHPLEFLAFAKGKVPDYWAKAGGGPCLGFDHSALTVRDTSASLPFYDRLGLVRRGGSLNHGIEQERLDGVPGAVVEVSGLFAEPSPPHVELLRYRGHSAGTATAAADVAATQLSLKVSDRESLARLVATVPEHLQPPGIVDLEDGGSAALLRDPDGHRLLLRAAKDPR
jgi:catechol 2,3-dioxygenase-like lactoylglutathione lyase family enzyme